MSQWVVYDRKLHTAVHWCSTRAKADALCEYLNAHEPGRYVVRGPGSGPLEWLALIALGLLAWWLFSQGGPR